MRILLLNNQVPFMTGGAELHAERLRLALRSAGHECEIATIPFQWYPGERLLDSIVAASALDVSEFNGVRVDLAIGLRFPAYLARHPRKVFWIIHQHRAAYDQWEEGTSDLLHQEDGIALRGAVEQCDAMALRGARVFANSRTVADRLRRFNGIEAPVLYHPPPLAGTLRPGSFGDYLLAPSRLEPGKRQDLILKALACCRAAFQVVFVGPEANPEWAERLRRLARSLGVEERVVWRGRVAEAELLALYAGARAVVFVPRDEDYGYVTLEAMAAGKGVLTATDSGGPLEFVSDGGEGLIAEPTPEALAGIMDKVATRRDIAEALGAAALARYRGLDLSWDRVVATLLGAAGLPPEAIGSVADVDPSPPPAADASRPPADRPWSDAARPATAGVDGGDHGDAGQEDRPRRTRGTKRKPPTAFDPDAVSAPFQGLSPEAVQAGLRPRRHAERLPAAYLATHWHRYLASLAALGDGGALRVLDLGSGPPFLFQALLRRIMPDAEFHCLTEEALHPARYEALDAETGALALAVETRRRDVERESFPYPDGLFDLVLAMEIVEHFSANPLNMFLEAARVLTSNGRLLVTTPNIISARSLANIWRGYSPYNFGVFIPGHGASARHNREYSPYEIEALGRMAGFRTELLRTWDVYGDEGEVWDMVSLDTSPVPPELRGQTVFWLGRKTDAADRSLWPSLFLSDPFAFRATLAVREDGEGNLIVRVGNIGEAGWIPGEADCPRLVVSVTSRLSPEQLRDLEVALPAAIPAGREDELRLPLARRGDRPFHLADVALRGGPHDARLAVARATVDQEAFWRATSGETPVA